MTHQSKNREAVLSAFAHTKEPKVLLSPSMTTGVDLPYEGCRFQIICKLPFADISSPQRKAQRQTAFGKELVTYDCAATLVQTYGRAMRAEDDYGVTYLLDGNFDWFRHAAKQYLPGYFMEALQYDVRLGPLHA